MLQRKADIVKYLYETCHAKVDCNAINNASSSGNIELIKYLYENYYAYCI